MIPLNNKTCARCKICKPLDQFYPLRRRGAIEFQPRCKDCNKEQSRQWYLQHKEITPDRRRYYTLKKYGLSFEDYNRMLSEQNRVCAICGKSEKQKSSSKNQSFHLSIDHDKHTGKVRGLLCAGCNQGIGKMDHNVAILKSAIKYLEKNSD